MRGFVTGRGGWVLSKTVGEPQGLCTPPSVSSAVGVWVWWLTGVRGVYSGPGGGVMGDFIQQIQAMLVTFDNYSQAFWFALRNP